MTPRILKNEIENDPLGRGYAGMTDAQIADDLNTAYRTRTRTILSSAEIYENIAVSEFQALTDTQKQYVRDILGLGENVQVGPGSKARTVMVNVFGAGSTTITALADALQDSISRAEELGLGSVSEGMVFEARTGA